MSVKRPDLQLLLCGIGITVLLLMPLPTDAASRRWPALIRDLTDFGHPLAFALFAHALFRSLRARLPRPTYASYWWTIAGVATYGAATEVVQAAFGRQPSLEDFRNDMLGAVFALALHWRREIGLEAARVALATLAAALAITSLAPLALTLAAYTNRFIRTPVLWTADSLLFAHLSHWQTDPVPALRLNEPSADWREHGHLDVVIENPMPTSQPVVVRVHDIWHDTRHADRFNRRYELAPLSRQILRISVEEIRGAPRGRLMDIARIRGVVVFSVADDPMASFKVHQIRLAPD